MTDTVQAREIRATLADGSGVTFPSVASLMRYVTAQGQRDHPERYAPDGTPLLAVYPRCTHTLADIVAGRCDRQPSSWAHRLAEWHRTRAPEPDVPDDDDAGGATDAGAPDLMRPVPWYADDHDAGMAPSVVSPPSDPVDAPSPSSAQGALGPQGVQDDIPW